MFDRGVEAEWTTEEWELCDIQDDGAEAFINGIKLEDNPHPTGTRKAVAWSDGWETEAQTNTETS